MKKIFAWIGIAFGASGLFGFLMILISDRRMNISGAFVILLLIGLIYYCVQTLKESSPSSPIVVQLPMKFKNPQNGYIITTESHGAYTLVFGGFYFAKHGAWGPALISFVLAIFTAGLSWLVYPFFARKIIHDSYLRKGWSIVS